MVVHVNKAGLIQVFKESINELVSPLDTILSQSRQEGDDLPNSLELIMGELTVVALIFMDIDLDISKEEINFLNDFRKSIYDDKVVHLTAPDYNELCNKCLGIYPHSCLSIDNLPLTIQYLQIYDQKKGTEYAKKAKEMFFRFAAMIARVDGLKDWEEHLILRNYRDVLYPKNCSSF